jgi:hypothetical protein
MVVMLFSFFGGGVVVVLMRPKAGIAGGEAWGEEWSWLCAGCVSWWVWGKQGAMRL